MKSFFSFVVVATALLIGSGAAAAPPRTTILQESSGDTFGTGPYSPAAMTTVNNSFVVCAAGTSEESTFTGVGSDLTFSSSPSLTWTPAVTSTTGFGVERVWTAPVTTGASTTVTVDFGTHNAHVYRVTCFSYTGHDAGSPVGGTGLGSDSDGDGAASLTLSPAPAATSDVLAIASGTSSGPGTHTVTHGTGWTEIEDINTTGQWLYHQIQSRTGSTSATVGWDDLHVGTAPGGSFVLVALEIKAAAAPSFDTGIVYNAGATTASVMAVSFDAGSTATSYFLGLVPANASDPTGAALEAGAGTFGEATGTPTGSSQVVTITADSPVHAYYKACGVLKNASGYSSVSCVASATYADTPMDAPGGDNWAVISGTCAAGLQCDPATTNPDAVVTDDVESTSLTSLGNAVIPNGLGGFSIVSGDPSFQTWDYCLFRKAGSPSYWECAEQSNGNTAPRLVSDNICNSGAVFSSLVYVAGEEYPPLDFLPLLVDAEGHPMTVTRVGGDAMPDGIELSMSTLSINPEMVGTATVELLVTDTYGGQLAQQCVFNIVSGFPPDVVGEVFDDGNDDDAIDILAEAFYTYSASYMCDPDIASGIVMSQDPEDDEEVAPRSAIDVVVSAGLCDSGGGGSQNRIGIKIGTGL